MTPKFFVFYMCLFLLVSQVFGEVTPVTHSQTTSGADIQSSSKDSRQQQQQQQHEKQPANSQQPQEQDQKSLPKSSTTKVIGNKNVFSQTTHVSLPASTAASSSLLVSSFAATSSTLRVLSSSTQQHDMTSSINDPLPMSKTSVATPTSTILTNTEKYGAKTTTEESQKILKKLTTNLPTSKSYTVSEKPSSTDDSSEINTKHEFYSDSSSSKTIPQTTEGLLDSTTSSVLSLIKTISTVTTITHGEKMTPTSSVLLPLDDSITNNNDHNNNNNNNNNNNKSNSKSNNNDDKVNKTLGKVPVNKKEAEEPNPREEQTEWEKKNQTQHSPKYISDEFGFYDMEKEINPSEGETAERILLNRTQSSDDTLFNGFITTNLTEKANLTERQIFFPEHFAERRMKHRAWFTQHHRFTRHELDPIDDNPFSSLIWKDKKYLISVLVPIGVGIAGAVIFVVAAYVTRSCRGSPQTFVPTVGTDLFLQHVHSRNDDIFLLMETTDDEM
ncbi:Hypothetical predicted protein [Octopus vulgaris]|nr:Hypothetical predicted protein [Octopus vulgaris]